jgi:hypothetical protein
MRLSPVLAVTSATAPPAGVMEVVEVMVPLEDGSTCTPATAGGPPLPDTAEMLHAPLSVPDPGAVSRMPGGP